MQIRHALRVYPTYSPPHPGEPGGLSLREGKANYEYFAESKQARLVNLRAWLSSFNVELVFTEAGLCSVDGWIHRYGGGFKIELQQSIICDDNPGLSVGRQG